MTGQILLLREFLSVFSGNELVAGVILAGWMLLTGAGCFLGGRAEGLRRPRGWLWAGQSLIAFLPVLHVAEVRLLERVFPPGVMLGLGPVFWSGFIVLAPFCLISGFLLPLYARVLGPWREMDRPGAVYFLDAIGSVAGGLLFSLALVRWLNPFQTCGLLMALNLTAVFWMRPGRGWRAASLLLLAAGLGILFSADWDRRTVAARFPGQELLCHQSTPYGLLAAARTGGQITLYQNGVPAGAEGDVAAAEESAHYALAQHPAPKIVLLLSAPPGAAREAAQYPLERMDFVEMDPAVLKLYRKLNLITDDSRLRLIADDARRFVESRRRDYDAILMGVPDPATLQLNRFYTREFFQHVRRALRPGGVFGFHLSGAANYASEPFRLLLSSVRRALVEVFPHVLLLPGRKTFFIASEKPLSKDIAGLLEEKNISARYVNRAYLSGQLTAGRLAAVREAASAPAPPNRDFHPASFAARQRYWLSLFGRGMAVPAGFMLFIFSALLWFVARMRNRMIPAALAATGFTGLGLEIVLLTAYQIKCGSLYLKIGLMVTAFLLGAALGAWRAGRITRWRAAIIRLDFVMAMFCLAAPAWLTGLQNWNPPAAAAWLFPVLYAVLTALAGCVTGAQFPLAAKILFQGAERTTGSLYGCDLLGSCLGAVAVSVFLLPFAGLAAACYILCALKCLTAAGLFSQRKDALHE